MMQSAQVSMIVFELYFVMGFKLWKEYFQIPKFDMLALPF